MLDPSAMVLFARVVEAGSFTGAARDLAISKSAVSKQISRLEDRLGVRLLNRSTRRLSLTEAGAAFHEGCRRVANEAAAAERTVSRLASGPRGELRVNAPMSFGIRHLGPCLADFLQHYPELTIDLTLNDRQVDLVEEGLDIAVRIGVLADSSLIAKRLAPSHRVVVAAPAYLAERGRPERPEQLADHACLRYSYQAAGREWRFRGPDGERRVRTKGPLAVNNGDVLRAAALDGLGVALLPTFFVGPDLRAGRLERLLPDWRDAQDSAVHAVYPANRNLSPKVRVFVDYLAERFGEAPYWDDGLAF